MSAYSIGLDYELDSITSTYIVTGIGSCTDTEIYIPPEYNGIAVTEIYKYAFNSADVTKIVVPASVEWIGQGAFSACPSLVELSIPFHGMTRDSGYPFGWIFYGGSSGYDSELYIRVTQGPFSFGYQDKNGTAHMGRTEIYPSFPKTLTTVIITDCENIEAQAFSNCPISNIQLPDNLKAIGGYAFQNCSATELDLPNGLTTIEPAAFRESKITQITIPSSVIVTEEDANASAYNAFYKCVDLTTVTFSDGVDFIWRQGFGECTALKSVTFSNTMTSISNRAFIYCGFKELTIPEHITSIEQYAFGGCEQLTTVTLPKTLLYLNDTPFIGCPSIGTVVCYAETPPVANTDIGFPETTVIYVPNKAVATYKQTDYWKNYDIQPLTQYQLVDVAWLENNLTNIATAVRAKTGESDLIAFEDIATAISALNVPVFNIKPIDVSQSYAMGNTWQRHISVRKGEEPDA